MIEPFYFFWSVYSQHAVIHCHRFMQNIFQNKIYHRSCLAASWFHSWIEMWNRWKQQQNAMQPHMTYLTPKNRPHQNVKSVSFLWISIRNMHNMVMTLHRYSVRIWYRIELTEQRTLYICSTQNCVHIFTHTDTDTVKPIHALYPNRMYKYQLLLIIIIIEGFEFWINLELSCEEESNGMTAR